MGKIRLQWLGYFLPVDINLVAKQPFRPRVLIPRGHEHKFTRRSEPTSSLLGLLQKRQTTAVVLWLMSTAPFREFHFGYFVRHFEREASNCAKTNCIDVGHSWGSNGTCSIAAGSTEVSCTFPASSGTVVYRGWSDWEHESPWELFVPSVRLNTSRSRSRVRLSRSYYGRS